MTWVGDKQAASYSCMIQLVLDPLEWNTKTLFSPIFSRCADLFRLISIVTPVFFQKPDLVFLIWRSPLVYLFSLRPKKYQTWSFDSILECPENEQRSIIRKHLPYCIGEDSWDLRGNSQGSKLQILIVLMTWSTGLVLEPPWFFKRR